MTGTVRRLQRQLEWSSMSYDGYAYENATSFALVLAWPTPLNNVREKYLQKGREIQTGVELTPGSLLDHSGHLDHLDHLGP